MKTASALFNDEQRQRVNDAVVAAESKTSAEIMTVVATDSGRYERAEDLFGLFLGLASMIIVWASFHEDVHTAGGSGGLPLRLQLPALVGFVLVGFVVGTLLAMKAAWLRRLFVPANQLHDEVAARSRQVFFDQRIHHTSRSTGLLIYLSLFERRAAILADQQTVEAIGQRSIDELCEKLTAELREGDATTALCGVIEDAGNRLARPLPRREDDVNEPADALVTIE